MKTEFGILEYRRPSGEPEEPGAIHTLNWRPDPKLWFWSETGDPSKVNVELGNDKGLIAYLATVGAEGWLFAGCGGTDESGHGPVRMFFQRSAQVGPQIPKPGFIGEDAERDADYYETMERFIEESKEVTEEDRERLLGRLEERRRQETQEPEVESSPPPIVAITGSGGSTVPKGVSNERPDELDLE